MVDAPDFDAVYEEVMGDDAVKSDFDDAWLDGYCKKQRISDAKCLKMFKAVLEEFYEDGLENAEKAEESETVYRAIDVPDVGSFIDQIKTKGVSFNHKTKKTEGVGVYWAAEEEDANPYWGEDQFDTNKKRLHTVVIEAEIDPDEHIDVMETIKAEVIYRRQEGEVRLNPKSTKPITITSVKWDDDKEISGVRWKAKI